MASGVRQHKKKAPPCGQDGAENQPTGGGGNRSVETCLSATAPALVDLASEQCATSCTNNGPDCLVASTGNLITSQPASQASQQPGQTETQGAQSSQDSRSGAGQPGQQNAVQAHDQGQGKG